MRHKPAHDDGALTPDKQFVVILGDVKSIIIIGDGAGVTLQGPTLQNTIGAHSVEILRGPLCGTAQDVKDRERERERERQADGRATEKADQYEVHAQHLDAFVLDISGRQTFGVACDDEKKCIFQAAAQAQLDAPSGVLNRVRYRVKLRRDMRQGHAERMVKARRRCKSRWVRILKAQFLRNPQLDSSATTRLPQQWCHAVMHLDRLPLFKHYGHCQLKADDRLSPRSAGPPTQECVQTALVFLPQQ